jgi:hypothetical protein
VVAVTFAFPLVGSPVACAPFGPASEAGICSAFSVGGLAAMLDDDVFGEISGTSWRATSKPKEVGD